MTKNSAQAAEFEELLGPHLDGLLRTARRLTQNAGDAEDLVQETLLKGFRFFDRFERDSNFKAWIFKILMNAFVNTYRRKKRRGPDFDVDLVEEATPAEVPASPPPSEIPGQREEAIFDLVDDRVKQAFDELPEHLRIVFTLSVIEDLKYREIADILDCPVGTVMSRLFRGRALLKERLAAYAEEAGYLRE